MEINWNMANMKKIVINFISNYSSSMLEAANATIPWQLWMNSSTKVLFFDIMKVSLGNIDKNEVKNLTFASERDNNAGDSVTKAYQKSF